MNKNLNNKENINRSNTPKKKVSIRKKNRIHRMMKNIFMMVLLVLIILGGFRVRALSVAAANVPTERIYASVQVQYGESLWTIAETYGEATTEKEKREYVRTVQNINHLTNPNSIQAGDSIVIYVDRPVQ